MNKHKIIRTFLIVAIVSLNAFCIIDGVKYGSYVGIILAIASLFALLYCMHLIKKMKELNEEE